MKNLSLRLFVLLILGFAMVAFPVEAQTREFETKRTELALTQEGQIPGISIAEGVTQITGVAISPLWGMSVMGAWKYWHTAPELRTKLPWYCHHYVWSFCFVILGMNLLKDVLGAAVPALVKKPFDFFELFEDKLSALVASGAFVPLVASAMAQYQQIPEASASLSMAPLGVASVLGLGGITETTLRYVFFIPLSVIGFFVVWLASHSINVLIALSPFSLLDTTLKLIKGMILGLVASFSAINPYLGLVICIPIILIAILISGWTFRFTTFGAALGLDLLRRKRAEEGDFKKIKAFSAREFQKVPVRTRGLLIPKENGAVEFQYRPWFILPLRKVTLDHLHSRLEIGVIYSEVHLGMGAQDGMRAHKFFTLLPRYQSDALKVMEELRLKESRETAMKRGVNSIRGWLREVLNFTKLRSKEV